MKSSKKPKDAFTRFFVKALSSVIEALTLDEKIVIERYGFGALLHFDKCFVPNNFAKWVANLVDYKSGDIVLDGKVISLTKESVHSVLGLPIGGSAFPSGSDWANKTENRGPNRKNREPEPNRTETENFGSSSVPDSQEPKYSARFGS